MTPRHFCTYFDSNYLPRALALYHSLRQHAGDFTLDVLCLDSLTCDILTALKLPGVNLLTLRELEADDFALVQAKQNRSWLEYIWTLTPSLIIHSQKRATCAVVTYLDADLYFYSSPEPVFDEFAEASIMLIPHRFARRAEVAAQRNGVFNVGMMAFRKDAEGHAALNWWRHQCLSACHAEPSGGKFGDQKYLDDWPVRFRGVKIISHKGANLAPWNISGYCITRDNGVLRVDGDRLVFYHFHKLDILGEWWFRSGVRLKRRHIQLVYTPYVRALGGAYRELRQVQPNFRAGFSKLNLGLVANWILRRQLTFLRVSI